MEKLITDDFIPKTLANRSKAETADRVRQPPFEWHFGFPMWFLEILKRVFPYRKPLARLTRLPVFGEVVNQTVFRGDSLVVLPKDRVIVHEAVKATESIILPSKVVHHFIDRASDLWIMDRCICRESEKCEDYPIDLGCLFMGKSVLKINPKFGRLVSREEAHRHEEKCREAGLVHIVGRDTMDSVWMGAYPGRNLLTVCNCCPCCCLFRFLPDLTPVISKKVTRMPGVSVKVVGDCTGCGKCTRNTCFVDAIRIENGRAVINEDCRGCGRCVEVCPRKAIQLAVTEDTWVEQTIERISGLVSVQ